MFMIGNTFFAKNEFFFTQLGGFCYIKLTMTDYNCYLYVKKSDIPLSIGVANSFFFIPGCKNLFSKYFVSVYLRKRLMYLMA